MLRPTLLAVAVSSTAAVVVAEPRARSAPLLAALEVLVIVGYATAGQLLAQDPRQRSNGRALTATALLQVVTHLHHVRHGPLPLLAWLAGPLSVIPTAVVLLRFPAASVGRSIERSWAIAIVGWLIGSRLTFTIPPPDHRFGWWPAIPMSAATRATASTVGNAGTVVLALAFAGLLVRRLLRSRGVARRELTPVVVAAVGATLTIVVHLVSVLTGRASTKPWVTVLESAGYLTIPAAFLFSAIVLRLARAAVADLLLRLNHPIEPAELQSALATTLSDPMLSLSFWLPETEQWVDSEGRAAASASSASRLTVPVEGSNGEPLAVIVTDTGLARHRNLLSAAVAASRLALENAQLHASVLAQLAEVRESRARLAQAAMTERRRMERDLHDGVQQRLLAIAMTLGQVQTSATDATTSALADMAGRELQDTLRELRDLARGIHPAVLTQSGLAAAVDSAAERMPLRVDTDIPDRRWASTVELTAYFVICEALTNTVRHAAAHRVEVSVVDADEHLTVRVRDDGSGGADLSAGTGLLGLADRVAAVGGVLDIDSPRGTGTCLSAVIPYASP